MIVISIGFAISSWIEDLMIRRKELTNYHQFENAPNTTNLIESYNSQLEQRTNLLNMQIFG
ncbi:hypothetical protein COT49_01720 [candidate division WWE3 bacterium CG08_land_8_20_14_0_20_40_13]|uniref:Uncharacterized protein n=1 Tax=candidate division WWE3 bacterium CG08_land_8_20_14_0_20_40_13 TaxID=1975084 RepID=A0A2H0XG75_UNCKA|nr:MAG: hypothetical protein COT49_01720 [candidate division WWE3 bacterium CG08_land_8_20_14_0_20_40_13]